jgi:prolyl 4-hydroxylase
MFHTTFLNVDPDVTLISNFISDTDIEEILTASKNRFNRSMVILKDAPTVAPPFGPSDERTSSTCMFRQSEFPALERVEDVVSRFTGKSKIYMEPFQLVRYDPEQKYDRHCDYLTNVDGGQRVMTILVYLHLPTSGGSTLFPMINLDIKPKKGEALTWSNVDKSNNVDPRTEHSGAVVHAGQKIAMNIWIRDVPYVTFPTP